MGVLAKEIDATYEVLSKMGEGGMGAIYKVRHRFFDEIRVIKVMQAQFEAVDVLKERFLGEAKRGKQLRHPNLAEVIDFSIASDGTAYMVMEYIEGVNLREVVARNGGPLDYPMVVEIAEQALSALEYLHSRKFVHRDISPDNLMLTGEGDAEPRIKLIDLGIAKSLEATTPRLTMVGKFVGKVQYASPEQFGGEVDGRSDVYSLGIVLYELLTGSKPISGTNDMAIIAGHMTRPPRSFEETDPGGRVPPAIRQAVLKAIEKRPEDRYPSAAAFAEALRAAIPPSDRRTLSVPFVTRPAVPSVTSGATAASGDDMIPSAASTELVTGAGAADPQATVVMRTEVERTAPPPRPRVRWWYATAVVLLLVAIAAVVALHVQNPTRRVEPVTTDTSVTTQTQTEPIASGTMVTVEPTTTTVAPPLDMGRLLINALPWGQITSVRDAAGEERLTAMAETPLVLSLAVGDYTIRLTNPNSSRSVVVDATVVANSLSRVETQLDTIDASRYVEGIGLGR